MPKLRIESLFLFVLLAMATFLLVGSFESRLANSSGDDHPMVWARYFTHPQKWVNDSNFVGAQAFGRASLPNLLATSLAKIHDSAPYWLSWMYVLIQNVGIGFALYLFSRPLVEERWTAVVVAILSFAMCPWQLNLAYYPNMMHSPYPGHLVMPFIVMAAYFLLQNHLSKSAIMLTVAGLIHPSQTLQFIAVALVFQFLSKPNMEFIASLKTFMLPMASSLAVPFLLIPSFDNPLSNAELLPSALSNPHLIPWNSTTFWPWGFPSLIAVFSLSALECRPLSKKASKLRDFWWANLIVLISLGTIHVVGAQLKVLPIILMCPFRVSVINSVLLAPIGFNYLIKNMAGGRFSVSWAASTLVLFLLLSKSGFFWGILLILFLWELRTQFFKVEKYLGFFVLGWWLIYLFTGRPARQLWGPEASGLLRRILSPGFSLDLSKIMFVFFFSLFLAFICRAFSQRKPLLKSILVICTSGFLVAQSYVMGSEALTGELKSVWDMQKWAKQSTAENSVFLIESGSWRGVSERQVQVVGYRKNQILAYFRYREAKEIEEKLQRLYGMYGTKNYNEIPDSGFLTFAKEFKGTHLVERASSPKRSFRIAFESSDWRIYELPRIN